MEGTTGMAEGRGFRMTLRDRLLLGMGLMLAPLLVIGGIDLLLFSRAGSPKFYLLVGLLVVGLLMALVVAHRLHQNLSQPLKSLQEAAERFGKEDLTYRLDESRDDELGALAKTFNSMAERMAHSRRLFQSAFEDASVGMVLANVDGRFLEVNHNFAKMLGYTVDQLLGHTLTEFTHPEDVEKNASLLSRALAGEFSTYTLDARFVSSDRRTVWVRSSVSVVRDPEGRPSHLVAQIQDVTHSRALEEQLNQSQKMEAVGNLAGGIAHDFNNILSVIQNYARFAHSGMGEGDPIRKDVEEIMKAGDRASGLVRQLLAFSRRQVIQPQVIDLNEVIAGVEKMLGRMIKESITLDVQTPDPVSFVRADPGQIEQVLMNLVVNAKDATPDGGTISVRTWNFRPDEKTRELMLPDKPCVCITVTDTGCGIPPDVQTRIFEPFFTTKPKGEGTGLGLSTAFGIVKQAGGEITVWSQKDQGTSFTIYLPVTTEQPKARMMVTPPPPPPPFPAAPGETAAAAPAVATPVTTTTTPEKETILLVEDEEGVRDVAARILSAYGYNVLVAECGPDALRLANGHAERIDLLLTDVIMPEMSGKELSEELKFLRSDFGVLFMSGYTDDIIAGQGIIEGRHAFLQKPFTSEKLLSKVREVLDPPVEDKGPGVVGLGAKQTSSTGALRFQ